jgi:hypothetical protein
MPAMNMPAMLAYTIKAGTGGGAPYAIVGSGGNATNFRPANPLDDSYWICILDASNPRVKVQDWVVPGTSNSTVPGGLDTYMNDPKYIFLLATQNLSTLHVPQGAFYNFLVQHGAGRELQKLEQLNTVLSCGQFSRVNYILTGQCGPQQNGGASYEISSFLDNSGTIMMKSLMPLPSGAPPYTICNSYTFKT